MYNKIVIERGIIMKKKIKILLVFISLSLTLSLMSNTYSRYVADTTGDLNLLFAKWQILVNENDITNNASSSINLVPVIEENEYVSSDAIAPSSKGYFDIDINPTNVGVSFDYSIALEVLNENMPDLMITKYAILDSTYNEGDEIQTTVVSNNIIEGSLNFNNEIENYNYEPFTIRVYFEWFEGTNEQMNDTQDTQVGHNAANDNTSLQIKATINFEQKLDASI